MPRDHDDMRDAVIAAVRGGASIKAASETLAIPLGVARRIIVGAGGVLALRGSLHEAPRRSSDEKCADGPRAPKQRLRVYAKAKRSACCTPYNGDVVDSRPRVVEGATIIRRRRQCRVCGTRFTTVEVVDSEIEHLNAAAEVQVYHDLIEKFNRKIREIQS